MKNEKIHSMLLGLVAGYVLFLAWELFDKYRAGSDEMPGPVFIIAIAVFTLGGLGTIWYAWKVYQKGKKAEAEKEEEKADENMQDKN